ncbi:MAG: PglZ domain-containing protein [Bacteroidota bacterium]
MNLRDYILDRWRDRLKAHEALVIYDPDGHYAALLADMDVPGCTVIDGRASLIQAREDAMDAWCALGTTQKGHQHLLVYLPYAAPTTNQQRSQDPFFPIALAGSHFPASESDRFQPLCYAAKPDHKAALDDLFAANPNPDIDLVDTIDAGAHWPLLRALLKVESGKEILVALLAPTEGQRKQLTQDTNWPIEYHTLARTLLGFASNRKTTRWDTIRADLARYVLFSELAFDLPGSLPEALQQVPRAADAHRDLIYAVCADLRAHDQRRAAYIDLARSIEHDLSLRSHFEAHTDFGQRDTFQFEERAYLQQFTRHVIEGQAAAAEAILTGRKQSVWAGTEERGVMWDLATTALHLHQAVSAEAAWHTQHTTPALNDLLDRYIADAYHVDTLQRRLEHTILDALDVSLDDALDALIQHVRKAYRTYLETTQTALLGAVQDEGWPSGGLPHQTQTYQQFVAPLLKQHGTRVAYVLVDAFRYELGCELLEPLGKYGDVNLKAVTAQMPTVTQVGMAALLADADHDLRLKTHKVRLAPFLGDAPILTPSDRLRHMQKHLGDRVAMLDLDAFTKRKAPQIDEGVHLLLVKTTEIDSAGESGDDAVLRAIQSVYKKLHRMVHTLSAMGFDTVVIATDHGFVLHPQSLSGQKADKPDGTWLLDKERCLIGTRTGATTALAFSTAHVGIRGDAPHVVLPHGFGVFRAGSMYHHGGLSLQEAVLPVLSLALSRPADSPQEKSADLVLSYKGGHTDRITSRRPMIEVALYGQEVGLFGGEETSGLTFRLEAQAGKQVVGQAATSTHVDPATGLITLQPGAAVKIPLRMDETFEGAFTVAAIDPATQVVYHTLTLKTDYLDF